jgi:D-amino-acid dehydrogenase
MQAFIVGGGLIGLTTAHYLAERGARVTLVDAGPRPASGASHANGGLLTPSMAEPWNAPGVTWQLLRWLGRPDAPLLRDRAACAAPSAGCTIHAGVDAAGVSREHGQEHPLAVSLGHDLQALRRDTGSSTAPASAAR